MQANNLSSYYNGVQCVPTKYNLSRWRKNLIRRHTRVKVGYDIKAGYDIVSRATSLNQVKWVCHYWFQDVSLSFQFYMNFLVNIDEAVYMMFMINWCYIML